jgi:hypothetical protein
VAFGLEAGGNQPISARISVSAGKFTVPPGLTDGTDDHFDGRQVNGKVGHR